MARAQGHYIRSHDSIGTAVLSDALVVIYHSAWHFIIAEVVDSNPLSTWGVM